jgi:heptosyltransferase-2
MFSKKKFVNPQNILVRMPNWLGDLVMATPILTDLKHHWPNAKLTVLCQGALSSVLEKDPHIDQIIAFDRKSKSSKALLNSLKLGKYDLGVLLTNSFSSAWQFWQGNIQNTVGYVTHWRRWLLDYPLPFSQNRDKQHLVITYKQLLEPLGIPVSQTPPKLYLFSQELDDAQYQLRYRGIEKNDFIIGINPGAAYGSAKCWLPERFKSLTHQLLKNPRIKILFFGDKIGAPLVDEICHDLPSHRVINLAGKTSLRELMAYIKHCQLFLTNDSGPMHVASALNTPLIALFGSTSDVATAPYQGGTVIHKHVPCSPCYRRECPIDFRCMKQIEVDEVYQIILRYLS